MRRQIRLEPSNNKPDKWPIFLEIAEMDEQGNVEYNSSQAGWAYLTPEQAENLALEILVQLQEQGKLSFKLGER